MRQKFNKRLLLLEKPHLVRSAAVGVALPDTDTLPVLCSNYVVKQSAAECLFFHSTEHCIW